MTPEDEEFLTELYRNLTKQAVPPTSAAIRASGAVARLGDWGPTR